MAKVAVVMGSESDFDVVKKTVEKLKAFGVESVVRESARIGLPTRRIILY